jgi:uncharacterized protein
VPDAYPGLRLSRRLQAPLLVLHGARDPIVPLIDGEALFDAAPDPKRIEVFAGAAHNDLIARAGRQWIEAITGWATDTCSRVETVAVGRLRRNDCDDQCNVGLRGQ